MLESGKHVLCEKPLCVTSKQTKALFEIAKSKRKFLMEVSVKIVVLQIDFLFLYGFSVLLL